MSFRFNDLPYSYNALEPYIDSQTMEIHHSKHHKTYYDKFIGAINGTSFEGQSLEEILRQVNAQTSPAVRNNGGGYYNHNLFWSFLSPNGGKEPQGDLSQAIASQFDSYHKLKEEMNQAGINRFGSGFVWLILNKSGKLQITSTPNQDNPLMQVAPDQGIPLLAIDVWEHAYYLK